MFRIIDHSCIYVLIAGTYTPFCLITLADAGGIPLCIAVWALAVAGILFEVFMRQRQSRWLTIAVYLVMGWLVVFRLPQLLGAAASHGAHPARRGRSVLHRRHGVLRAQEDSLYAQHLPCVVLAGSVLQFLAVVLFVI